MEMKTISRIALIGAAAASLAVMVRPALAEDYIIGAEIALTGTYAWIGVPSREGLDVGIEEVNASGMLGANKLKVLIEDTASDKTQAISLINRFKARDKAVMVLGPSSSSEGVAVGPVANELKIPSPDHDGGLRRHQQERPMGLQDSGEPCPHHRRRRQICRRQDGRQKRCDGMGPQQ